MTASGLSLLWPYSKGDGNCVICMILLAIDRTRSLWQNNHRWFGDDRQLIELPAAVPLLAAGHNL